MEDKKPWGIEMNAFCLMFHLSQLTSMVLPGAGIVLPIIMWATNKEEFPVVDAHGRNILNWSISLIIYLIVCVPLMIIYIGFLGIVALLILNFVFVIIAAIKANDGIVWQYPLSIQFFKVTPSAQI